MARHPWNGAACRCRQFCSLGPRENPYHPYRFNAAEAKRPIWVSEQAFHRCRAECGDLRLDQARRLKQLETENSRLRRAVAKLTLDNHILKRVRPHSSLGYRPPAPETIRPEDTAPELAGGTWKVVKPLGQVRSISGYPAGNRGDPQPPANPVL